MLSEAMRPSIEPILVLFGRKYSDLSVGGCRDPGDGLGEPVGIISEALPQEIHAPTAPLWRARVVSIGRGEITQRATDAAGVAEVFRARALRVNRQPWQ